jgi:DNA-binding NarL/FixJ family response regulator
MIASSIKVIVVDDHGLFRFGLGAILESAPEMKLIAQFADASVLESLPELKPDVIVCDLSLGSNSGLDLIKTIKKKFENIKVLVVSMHKDEFHITHAIEAGASGYVYKDDRPEELLNGIRQVAAGEKYFSKEISRIWMNRISNNPNTTTQPFLTKKEKEVVHYIMQGLTSKEIAEKMFLSARTVETHRYNILNKLGLRNVTELVKMVADQKIAF